MDRIWLEYPQRISGTHNLRFVNRNKGGVITYQPVLQSHISNTAYDLLSFWILRDQHFCWSHSATNATIDVVRNRAATVTLGVVLPVEDWNFPSYVSLAGSYKAKRNTRRYFPIHVLTFDFESKEVK